jgi:hypothetical protein
MTIDTRTSAHDHTQKERKRFSYPTQTKSSIVQTTKRTSSIGSPKSLCNSLILVNPSLTGWNIFVAYNRRTHFSYSVHGALLLLALITSLIMLSVPIAGTENDDDDDAVSGVVPLLEKCRFNCRLIGSRFEQFSPG